MAKIPAIPWGLAVGDGAVWVTGEVRGTRGATLFKVAVNGGIVRSRRDERFGLSIAVSQSRLWIAGSDRHIHTVYRLNPTTLGVVSSANLGKRTAFSLAASGGDVWVAGARGVTRLDGANGKVRESIPSRVFTFGLAILRGAVWAGQGGTDAPGPFGPGQLSPLAGAGSQRSERIPLGITPTAVAASGGYVWAAAPYVGPAGGSGPYVLRIETRTHTVSEVPLPGTPIALMRQGEHLWALLRDRRTMVRIC